MKNKFNKNAGPGERYAWSTLIISLVIFLTFIEQMTNGLHLVALPPTKLIAIYIRMGVMFAILHAIVAIIFVVKRKDLAPDGSPFERDERDTAIERTGNQFGFWVLSGGVGVIIFLVLMENAQIWTGLPVSLLTPTGLFLGLLSTILLADMVKRIAMIYAYKS